MIMEIKTTNDITSSESTHINGFTLTSNSSSKEKFGEIEELSEENSVMQDDSSEVLPLLQLCKNFNKERLTSIDNNKDLDATCKYKEKINVLQSYLEQVEEQNDVLAATMIELEKEAKKRVKQMESRLKSSAKTTMEAVINIHECEKEMRKLVEERLSLQSLVDCMGQHISSLKVENNHLQDQNCNLNHDLQSLLHVIQHARSTGHWEMNCITFCEVAPEQIFGPIQSISQMHSNESHTPASDCNFPDEDPKGLNSDFSSQDVSHLSKSSQSSMNLSGDPGVNLSLSSNVHNKMQEKDKKIAVLESHISELQHALSGKEAECDCHLWKLEMLMQHNQNRTHVFPQLFPPVDASVQKCISLPDIGNIYSFTSVLRRSHSCKMSHQLTNLMRPSRKKYPFSKNSCHVNVCEKPDSRLCKYSSTKNNNVPGIHKAQSEPYLFMFGDNVYVYRPGEPIEKASNIALCSDYQMSLPPCQSIDLKFPVDDSNLKICDWDDFMHKSSISYNVPDCPYHKVDVSNPSCSSKGSIVDDNSLNIVCSNNSCLHIRPNKCTSHMNYRKSYLKEKLCNSLEILGNNHSSSKSSKFVSLAVQTEERATSQSIGLQTDIDNADADLLNGNLFELDLSQLRRTIQSLKDNVLKAEDKAEAKTILIEQLQGHITSAFKEVELKDKALNNVEKKLEASRAECLVLKETISTLNAETEEIFKDIENLRMLNDNLQLKISGKDEKIQELIEEQKMLQNQKRALMTQLDVQGDAFEGTKYEFDILKKKTNEYILQVELQSQTIKNLQEALVESKRASDNIFSKNSSSSVNISSLLVTDTTTRGSIVDI